MLCLGLDSGTTTCKGLVLEVNSGKVLAQTRALEKIVKSAVKVDRKTRAEPGKENETLYAELRGRHADLTQKLANSGYL